MIRFFAAHPTAANLLMLALIAAGVLSVGDLRRAPGCWRAYAVNEVALVILAVELGLCAAHGLTAPQSGHLTSTIHVSKYCYF